MVEGMVGQEVVWWLFPQFQQQEQYWNHLGGSLTYCCVVHWYFDVQVYQLMGFSRYELLFEQFFALSCKPKSEI